jgi:hypothetical protein
MNQKSIASGILAITFFFSNALAVYAAETNYWADRRAQQSRRFAQSGGPGASPNGDNAQASLLLAQLPGAQAVRLDGANMGAHSYDVPLTPVDGIPSADLNAAQTALARDGSADWLDPIVNPYGTVREIYLSKKADSPLVIHIQDVHGYVDAQKNIAGMIDGLAKYRGVNLIGMEAAEGAFALEDLRRFPDRDIKERVTNWAIKKDLIGGAEKSGIMSEKPLTLWGVENTPLYQANVQAVKDSLARRSEALKFHGELVKDLARLKTAVYSDSLKKYDENLTAYQDQRRGLGDYLRHLAGQTVGGAGELTKDYPNTGLLLNALEQESRLDFKQVERERVSLVELLAARLDEKTLNGLVKESMAYRAGRITYGRYYAYVKDLCRQAKIDLGKFPGLTDYIAYVGLSEKINRNHLLSELEKLEESVATSLARTDVERSVLALSRDSVLLGKLLNNAMTPEEWARYLVRRGEIGQLEARSKTQTEQSGVPFETIFPQDFAGFVTPFEEFCRLALARDEAMADRLFAKMGEDQLKAAMLVTGGFHTEGLLEEIKRRGGSYVVLTPRVEIVQSDKNYLDAFAHDPLPLEKLFDGEKIAILTMRTTTANAQINPLQVGPTASSAIQFAVLLESVRQGLAVGKQTYEIQRELGNEINALKANLNLENKNGGYLTVSLAGVNYMVTFQANGDYVIKPGTNIRKFIVAFVMPIAETILYGILTPIMGQLLAVDPTGIGWAIGFLAPMVIGFLSAMAHVILWKLQGKKPTLRDFFLWWGEGTLFSLPFTLFPLLDWNGDVFASWVPHAFLNPAVVFGFTDRLGDKYQLPWLKNLKPASLLSPPAESNQDRILSFLLASLSLFYPTEILSNPLNAFLQRLRGRPPPSSSIHSGTISQIINRDGSINPVDISRLLSAVYAPINIKGFDTLGLFSSSKKTDESDITKVFPQSMTFGIEIEFQLNKQNGSPESVLPAVNAILIKNGWPPLLDYSGNFKEATSVVMRNTPGDWARLKAVLKALQEDPLSQGVYSVHMHIGKREMNKEAMHAKKDQVGRIGKAFEAMWRALSGRGYSRPGGNISPMRPGALLGDRTLFFHESIINLSGRYPTIEVKIISGLLNQKGHLPVDDLEDHLWFVFALFTAATHPDRQLPLVELGRPVIAGEKPSGQQIKAFLDQVFGDWDPHGRRLAEAKFNSLADVDAGLTFEEITQGQNAIKQVYRKVGLGLVYDFHDAAEGHIDLNIIEHLLQPDKLKSIASDLVRSGASDEQALAFFPAEMYIPLLEALALARREIQENVVPNKQEFSKVLRELSNTFIVRNPRVEFARYIQEIQPSRSSVVSDTFNRYLTGEIPVGTLTSEFFRVTPRPNIWRDLPARVFTPSLMEPRFRRDAPLIRGERVESTIRWLLKIGYSKRSITGISKLVFSLTVSLVNLALYIPNLISTTVYLGTIFWAFGSSVVGIFGLLGYKQFLKSIGLGRWARADTKPANSDEVTFVIRRLFPSHQGDLKKIVLVSRIIEDDSHVVRGAYSISDDGKTLTLKSLPDQGSDQFAKNAHFDPLSGTLFVLETVARSSSFALGTVLAHEIGKKEFYRWKFQTPLLDNARVAEFFGNLYEILYLMNLPLPRITEANPNKRGSIWAFLAVLAISLAAQFWNPPAIESPPTGLPQTVLKREVSNPVFPLEKTDGAYISALFDSIKEREGTAGTFENTEGLIEALKALNNVRSIKELRDLKTILYPVWPITSSEQPGSWNILRILGLNSVAGAFIEALFYLFGAAIIGNALIPAGELSLEVMISLFFDVTGTAFLALIVMDFFIHFFGGVGQTNGQPSVTIWNDGLVKTAKEALKATFTATNNAYMLPLVVLGLLLMPIAPVVAWAMAVFGFILGAYKHAIANYRVEMSSQVSQPVAGVTVLSTPITEEGILASAPTVSLNEMLRFAFAGGKARTQYDGVSQSIHRVSVTRQGRFAANDKSLSSENLAKNHAAWVAQQALANRGERGQDAMQALMIFLNNVAFFAGHVKEMAVGYAPGAPTLIEVPTREMIKANPMAIEALASVVMAGMEVSNRPMVLVMRGDETGQDDPINQIQTILNSFSPTAAIKFEAKVNENEIKTIKAENILLRDNKFHIQNILYSTFGQNKYTEALVFGDETHFESSGIQAEFRNYFRLAESMTKILRQISLFDIQA